MRSARAKLVAVGLCSVLCHAQTVAAAPPVEGSAEAGAEAEAGPEPSTAGEWYARGIELGNAGDFVGAAEAFLRSYELQPTSEALFNAGLALRNAGDTIAAIETFRRFLAEPEHNAELARAAEEAIAKLMREVGTLKGIRYEASRAPAELYVAGERRELDELPLLLPPGPVEIEVVDEAGERAKETYEIAPGEALVIDVRALLPAKIEGPDEGVEVEVEPTPEQLEADRRRRLRVERLRTATWVGLGLSGAALISYGSLSGVAARERSLYLEQTCLEDEGGICPPGFTPGEPDVHFRSYQRLRVGALVSVGLAGGFAIGSLVAGLVSLRLEKRQGAKQRARVRVAPQLGGFAVRF